MAKHTTNEQVILAFIRQDDISHKSHSMTYCNGILYSYSEPIAVMYTSKSNRVPHILHLNDRKYSVTTTKQQNAVASKFRVEFHRENGIIIKTSMTGGLHYA